MRAMILAAGKGERMRPLTDLTPKPLLQVADKPLIEYHLEHLVRAGFRELVINVSWLGQQIEDYLGDGSRWGCDISWSREPEPLETAGGIAWALPLLGAEPFALINGDIWIDFPLEKFERMTLAEGCLAHLVLVNNPPHHPDGDFLLGPDARLSPGGNNGATAYTYSGLALYHPRFFEGVAPNKLPLRPLLQSGMRQSTVTGEYFAGHWLDLGTPERLAELDAHVRSHLPGT
jgi:MurNAc alpha-1-phosphate uridylyltransferase